MVISWMVQISMMTIQVCPTIIFHIFWIFFLRQTGQTKLYFLQFSDDDDDEDPGYPWQYPKGICAKIWWLCFLPLNLLFFITIPDVRRPNLVNFFPLSFLMSVAWIGKKKNWRKISSRKIYMTCSIWFFFGFFFFTLTKIQDIF